jgi:hypothetical protein
LFRGQGRPARVSLSHQILSRWRRHKVAGTDKAIEAAGAQLRFLLDYSPDLNQSSSSSLNMLREVAVCAVETLWTTIGQLIDNLSPGECGNYFRHADYVRLD